MTCQTLRAQENLPPAPAGEASYEGLKQEINRLEQMNQDSSQTIKNLSERIEALERMIMEKPPQKKKTQTEPLEQKSDETRAALEQEAQENYELIQTAFERRFGVEQGMLLRPYEFVYEPSLFYAHTSYDKIVIDGFTIFPVLVVGDIVSESMSRDIMMTNHSFRIGLPWDLQFDLFIPVGYQKERTVRADGLYTSDDTGGIGDISLGLSHQLFKSHSFMPDTLIGVSWKSTTGDDPYRIVTADEPALGSGFQTWGLSLTSMTTLDPVILYGGLSWTYSPGKDKVVGHVKPGQSFGFHLGTALALNLDTSLSFGFQSRYTLETELDGTSVNGSYFTTSTFSIGLSKVINDFSSVDFNVGIGLTSDSPDFQVSVSFPLKFLLKDEEPAEDKIESQTENEIQVKSTDEDS
ncbi:MAG: transporter [Desulfobacter sp.]|nr:MAG: transporter [Desulfobacter sp.]